jgi:hypothetical protein
MMVGFFEGFGWMFDGFSLSLYATATSLLVHQLRFCLEIH